MKRIGMILACGLLAASASGGSVSASSLDRLSDGIVVQRPDGRLRLQVCADGIIRVAFSADDRFFQRESLMLDPARRTGAEWSVAETADAITVRTAKVQARIDRATGTVTFLDAAGATILAERAAGRVIEPAEVQGEQTAHVRQTWVENADEALFGLGENQLGLLNLKGRDLDLWQHNGTVAVPFLVSNRGYGILWDNNSYTRFGDLRPYAAPAADQLLDAEGRPGGLTASYFAGRNFDRLVATRQEARIDLGPPPATESIGQVPAGETAVVVSTDFRLNTWVHPELKVEGPVSVRWEGFVVPRESGVHTFHTFSNSGIKVWVDGRLVINHWRQGWLPWNDVAPVALTAGQRHALRIEWVRDENPTHIHFDWKTPAPDRDTTLWSEVGEGTDYYFVYGPSLDDVIAGYRRLTGAAAMLPKWAFGLWQSRQRYETQQQSIDVVRGYRSRGIPIDVIVQDWFYWPKSGWGSHQFDPERFPDPDGWIRTLHDELHARLLISVWPKFYPGTANFEAFQSRGWLYEPNLKKNIRDWIGFNFTYYDAFHAGARKLFWAQIEPALFRRGVDAWWLDGSEPDLLPAPTLAGTKEHLMPTVGGTGSRVLNAYPQQNARAVYEGQRGSAPDQRVVILTRSGFAGQQRFAGAVWSGDTSSTWEAMAKQIPAALGFALSGMPYWTMDVGGFAVPARFSAEPARAEDVAEWRELNTRWFQFGTFTPMLRVHGEKPLREMWEFGGETGPDYQTQLHFNRLRYRLLPYVYSLAGAVTHDGGSFLRPLVMDFPADARACEVRDQYLFGPALLVSPVTAYRARSREVYLPAAAGGWYDFWSGRAVAGGATVEAPAPYERIPVHVRAGSIVPVGPELQWAEEKPAARITLWVYAGADGAFTLYEDDGRSYGYERGECARIPLRWDDATRTLTIGERRGSFPGMLAQRTFDVVLVSAQQPAGFTFEPETLVQVQYTGRAESVRLQ